jgi:cell filamentation protein
VEATFEPGSRGRVLRNLQGIKTVREMQAAESRTLEAAQVWMVRRFDADHRLTGTDIRAIHKNWLGSIYGWAGEYRQVNIGKGGFMFAAAPLIPRLMDEFERKVLGPWTPCQGMDELRLVAALARTHAELVIIHPFREGNGRCARLVALLMALQAGMPPLDFHPLQGRGRAAYIAAIHAAFSGNYRPMEEAFERVIRRTWASWARVEAGL